MTETYSLATTGQRASSPFAVNNVTLPDSAGRSGSEAYAMRFGSQVLCKGPDGMQRWYTIDASRSLPGGPIVLLAVGP